MEKIVGKLQVVKTPEDLWDVIVLAEEPVLKAFSQIYSNVFYIEKSAFEEKPIIVAPDFGDKLQALTWAHYWQDVFDNPNKACTSCATVVQFLEIVQTERVRAGR